MHKEQIMQDKHVLEKIIEVLILCGKQNIAIRGHTETCLQTFKMNCWMCYDQLREQIVRDCNKASCFALLQMSVLTNLQRNKWSFVCVSWIRWRVNRFLCFVEAESTTGESISELLLEALDSAGVNIDKMRGQGYDGTGNMSGLFNGVQARIKERVPTASYVHCKSHQLNLAIVHSSNIPSVRTMMGTVQDIGFAFSLCRMR